jgi:formate hydrogenlyase transcriptional activator
MKGKSISKVTDLPERHNSREKRLEDLTQFERLLFELSAKYINMPFGEIESSAKNDFGRLAGLLGGDSCNFHLFDEEKQDWMTLLDSSERTFLWVRRKKFAEQLKNFRDRPDFGEKMEYMFKQWDKGKYATAPSHQRSKKAEKMEQFVFSNGIDSFASVPILASGLRIGAITITTFGRQVFWPDNIMARIRLFGEILANALMRKRSEESLRAALADVKRLKDQIEADYIYLTEEINLEQGFSEVVGISQALRQILVKVKQVAPTNATVLLTGETGTGKGVIARAIHNASGRNNRPLIQVNCAALAPGLIESELFGHEKGAFTGAVVRKIGRFELADGTTLFLDEIGDLPLDLQAKLLRVLQEGEFERVGGTPTLKTDVRIIAATNKDLQKEADEGRFRSDLWYRLSVFPIHVPPLRERRDDIPALISYFVNKYEKRVGKRFNTISRKMVSAAQGYSWPGNIRELENLVERAVITSPDGNLRFELPSSSYNKESSGKKDFFNEKEKLWGLEREFFLDALSKTCWKIEGMDGAASIMGFKPSTFRAHMKKLGIRRPGIL